MLTYNCRTAAENKFPHKKHPSAPHISIYDPPTPEFAVGRVSLPAGLTEFILPPITGKLRREEHRYYRHHSEHPVSMVLCHIGG